MAVTRHDTIDEVLTRVDPIGFEIGPGFTGHAPMATEALITLGHLDEAVPWIDRYIREVPHHPRPEPTAGRIDPRAESDLRGALGDLGRLGDWEVLVRDETEAAP